MIDDRVVSELVSAFKLLELQKGWDGDQAEPIDKQALAWTVTIYMLLFGSEKEFGSFFPFMGPCPDGTVDIFWGYDRLLVNVGPQGVLELSTDETVPERMVKILIELEKLNPRTPTIAVPRCHPLLRSLSKEEYDALPNITEEEFSAAMVSACGRDHHRGSPFMIPTIPLVQTVV